MKKLIIVFNGGDMTMLFATRYPQLISKAYIYNTTLSISISMDFLHGDN
ncbi:hypothetical protein [Bacteroides finegoldii]|nr:hypothetical protein [Bacteroides finegoldii]